MQASMSLKAIKSCLCYSTGRNSSKTPKSQWVEISKNGLTSQGAIFGVYGTEKLKVKYRKNKHCVSFITIKSI